MHRRTVHSRRFRSHGVWWLLLCLILVVFGAFFWKQWITSVFLTRQWRVNIALNSTPVTIVSFPASSTDDVLFITLPETAFVTIPWNYGPYRVGAIEKLAKLENKPNLFTDSMTDLLGVVIHSSLGNSEPIVLHEDKLLADIKNQLTFAKIFSFESRALNLFDRLILSWRIYKTSTRDVRLFTTHTTDQLFVDEVLPDGSKIKVAQPERMTKFIEKTFEESTVRTEGLSVSVLNETATSGVGQQFARFISTIGGKVITVSSDLGNTTNCKIEGTKTIKNQILISYLTKEFGCSFSTLETTEAADITVRVGSHFAERWKH